MPESKKSPPEQLPEFIQSDSGEWYEKVLNDQIVKNENKILEEKINALEKRVEELSTRPIGKIMYRPPGHTKHMQLAEYLDDLENRLNTIELRIELDV
tara:strand:- start:52071 stop:52364 length:294 start_codon:yes stop_codon:yes gene_type:complete